MGKKILAVIRTSTIRQEIQAQKQDLIKFCCSKGFKETDIIFVEGFGASARKRNDKYLQMLNDIKASIELNHIKFVAVWHLNRLGRTEENLSALKEYFEENKIQVYIKNPSLTLFNDDGTLNNGTSMAWTIFAMMIKFETIELMEKLSRGRIYKKEQKKYIGGRVLYGYLVNEYGYFKIDEKESEVVRFIFDCYVSGKYSASDIMTDLLEKGYLNRKGKSFSSEFISKVIRTEDYYNDVKYPSIITKEQFDRCRDIAIKNNVCISKERKVHLGSKILKCLSCGYSFFSKMNNVKGEHYVCTGSRLHVCSGEVGSIKVDVLDYCLRSVSLKVYSSILLMKKEVQKNKFNEELQEIKKRICNVDELIQDTEKRITRLNKLYVEGKYLDDSLYNSDYEKLISELDNYNDRKGQLLLQQKSIRLQVKVLNNGSSNQDVLSKYLIYKDTLSLTFDKDKRYLKDIINLVISFATLKKVVVNGKKYVAIIIKLLNGFTELYFWNTRQLYYVKWSALKDDCICSYVSYNDSLLKNTQFTMSKEQYYSIISIPESSPLSKI